jgi:hypothetical protein
LVTSEKSPKSFKPFAARKNKGIAVIPINKRKKTYIFTKMGMYMEMDFFWPVIKEGIHGGCRIGKDKKISIPLHRT